MGSAKRRKKLDPSWGQDQMVPNSWDYLRIAEQFILIEVIIENRGLLSEIAQDYVLPEEYRLGREIYVSWCGNADTSEWLLDAADSITWEQLGAPFEIWKPFYNLSQVAGTRRDGRNNGWGRGSITPRLKGSVQKVCFRPMLRAEEDRSWQFQSLLAIIALICKTWLAPSLSIASFFCSFMSGIN